MALGKFDAMHRGHAELARQASKMGAPILASFGGMAEVLGWEEKLPVVAPGDRARVLEMWKAACEGKTVREHVIPFADIRRMSPEEFVSTLKDIGVGGVVAGANYRFGFKAAGTADTLKDLGEKLGVDVSIVDLLPANEPGDGGLPGWIREHAAGFVHPRPSVPRRRGRGTGGEAARSEPLAGVADGWRGGRREVSHERGDEPVPGDWTVRRDRRGSRRREDADDRGGDGQGDRSGGVGRDERRERRRERVRGVCRSRCGCLARRL